MSPRHCHHVTLSPNVPLNPPRSSPIQCAEPCLCTKDCHHRHCVTTTVSPRLLHHHATITMSPSPQRLPVVPSAHPLQRTELWLHTKDCHRVTNTTSPSLRHSIPNIPLITPMQKRPSPCHYHCVTITTSPSPHHPQGVALSPVSPLSPPRSPLFSVWSRGCALRTVTVSLCHRNTKATLTPLCRSPPPAHGVAAAH